MVAAASFTLSFFAQSEVAASLGAVPAHLAWLVPVTIDGGILAGSASVWASSARRAKKDPVAYFTVAALLSLSVVINVQHASDAGGALGAVISGTPPVILLLCLELVAAQARRDAKTQSEPAPNRGISAEAATGKPPINTPTVPEPKSEIPPTPSAKAPAAPRPTSPPTPKPVESSTNPPQDALNKPKTVPTRPVSSTAAKKTDTETEVTPPPATKTPNTAPRKQPATDTRSEPPTQAERVRALFQKHVDSGGDAREPSLARTIATQLDAPVASVRKVVAQERKKLDDNK